MSVMAETSQSATGPYVAIAAVGSVLYAWTAVSREALVVKVAARGGGGLGDGGDGAGGGGDGDGGDGDNIGEHVPTQPLARQAFASPPAAPMRHAMRPLKSVSAAGSSAVG